MLRGRLRPGEEEAGGVEARNPPARVRVLTLPADPELGVPGRYSGVRPHQ